MKLSLTAVLAVASLTFVVPAWAQDPLAEFPDVMNASAVRADGERVISLSVFIPVPTQDVWTALTTEGGWVTHMGVAQARLDMRIGGDIETSYSKDEPLGGPGTIVNQIVAYVPERMLAIRNTRAPASFDHAAEFGQTVTVIELTPQDGGTRVDLHGVGFVSGAAFDALYAMFLVGDAYTLQRLRESLTAVSSH